MIATATANSNIAFIKYWGKKDEALNIPMNPSISMTLDASFSTTTSVEFSEKFRRDEFFLDGVIQSGDRLLRVIRFLDLVREKAASKFHVRVISHNTFPSGSGIASSASGFAALAAASSKAFGLSPEEIPELARRGSGSAIRSVHGGFVEWQGRDAVQMFDERYWPELVDIIVIVSSEEKAISSREGMQLTKQTSQRYKARLDALPKRINQLKHCLSRKDFQGMAKIIMLESDDLHMCMEDTTPPLIYLTPVSQEIKRRVQIMNSSEVTAAYTFDAGPNAHIITLASHKDKVLKRLEDLSLPIRISKAGGGIQR